MSTLDTKEKNFEQDIEAYFLSHGYNKGNLATYDRTKAIDMPVLISFIEKTQPKQWQRYVNQYGDKAEKQLYKIFQENVSTFGLLKVLREGIKDRGVGIRFAYFEPASNLNEELVEKYHSNILTCTRQFAYSTENHNTIDMVLLLNGIPVVTIELKNQLTGQCVDNAKRQFMYDRNPKEFPFRFNNRFLVYFAVDLYEVWMTTCLKGEDTYFLPFNQGSNGAGNVGLGGNPENPNGYATSYLWENVLSAKTLLSILQRYMNVEINEKVTLKDGKKKTKKSEVLIFPRYHQLDVVEKLIESTRNTKEGRNYLLQHSAGSGKSNEIAWLAYRLSSLHDNHDKEMFQTVFVVTDRRILNRQLQNTILGFDHKKGQIVTITDKDNSTVLRDAINDKKRIIITTLHRFPIIYKELDAHTGKKFAIIVDEAHSSQSGKSAEKLKAALADTDAALKEMAEIEGKAEEQIRDEMDNLTETLLTQGQHKNEYFYAFTATPKPKTLQVFGEKKGEVYDAFHHYSMKQAIDEGFILDVLKYYTTIETAYKVVKTIHENPEFEEPPATRAIKLFHDNHEMVIRQKIEVIVEKFREVTLKKIDGRGKAMVVCPSRAHALRYFFAMKEYCKEKGYTDVRPLVAFSGSVKYNEEEYTEPQLNTTEENRITEANLPLYFSSDLYNILIVADKYQTGFDEPLLHTMFVDKSLKGVKAVQTLSRLNRCCKGKIDTYVLDFANTAESIKKSFEPFYEDTLLGEEIDINMVYKYQNLLRQYNLWDTDDEEKLFEVYSSKQTSTSMGKLTSILKPVVTEINALDEEDQFKIRFLVKSFNRLYSYMAQIARTYDKELYKSYIFTEFLFNVLPKHPHQQVNLDQKLALAHNKLSQGFSGSIVIKVEDNNNVIVGEKGGAGKKVEEKKDLLGNIIDKINNQYAGNLTDGDKVIVETIYGKLQKANSSMKRQAQNNDVKMFTDSIFPKKFDKVARDCYMEQMDSFSKLFEDPEFYGKVMKGMAQEIYFNLKGYKK